ncbi:ethanolamine ammonia-lyase subunit EutC [Marinivivus vitaminiproducens]|uniref:ethanolamine ammonia-lyase subunit EutC n=1 Tax=Marinivivus vitaminiproducens TaxID=3035935 RepID=UPI0027A3E077|nr:ethanolamine ammonia-lyase subunit EutC [Geminicoccaceae bacterium SCSIO 64248]
MSGKKTEATGLVPALPLAQRLRRFTDARVALGRAGSGLPTEAHLRFMLDHARARDAVLSALDLDAVTAGIERLGLEVIRVRSEAADRASYLRRPDLGRRLLAEDRAKLAPHAGSERIALVVADGLSATAVAQNTAPLLDALRARLGRTGLSIGRAVLVEQGRVAIGDPIGEALGAELAIVLLGERPGLSAADSLGCYITYEPRPGTPDSRRNCISNIRPGGHGYEQAAGKIAWLAAEALTRKLTGVQLKEAAPGVLDNEDTPAPILPESGA